MHVSVRLRRQARRTISGCLAAVSGVAFWTAALFPVVHVLFLAAVSYGAAPSTALLWPVAGHVLAVLGGHRYEPAGRIVPDGRSGRAGT